TEMMLVNEQHIQYPINLVFDIVETCSRRFLRRFWNIRKHVWTFVWFLKSQFFVGTQKSPAQFSYDVHHVSFMVQLSNLKKKQLYDVVALFADIFGITQFLMGILIIS
ncbi:hypothetical protein ACJX0J_037590, partial [Zea mays]